MKKYLLLYYAFYLFVSIYLIYYFYSLAYYANVTNYTIRLEFTHFIIVYLLNVDLPYDDIIFTKGNKY